MITISMHTIRFTQSVSSQVKTLMAEALAVTSEVLSDTRRRLMTAEGGVNQGGHKSRKALRNIK